MADPQHAMKEWIADELDRRGRGAAQMLARHLGVKPDYITRLKNTDGTKQMRRVDAHMVPSIACFFDSIPPGFDEVAEIKCKTCAAFDRVTHGGGNTARTRAMTDKPKEVTIIIETPQQGTLVVGDNNTVTTHNSQTTMTGTALSAEQALKLDTDVKDVAAASGTELDNVWRDLCEALDVPDSALITREVFPAAEKILAYWKGRAIRNAINENGGQI